MNRWQRAYLKEFGLRSAPREKQSKWYYEALGKIRETVTVHFPERNGLHGKEPACVNTYTVDEKKLDMPNGMIDVITLAVNLEYWTSRGYKMTTGGAVQD